MLRVFLSRTIALFRRRSLDRWLDEELTFHLEMEAQANHRRGMTDREAVSAARRAFGGEQRIKEIYRERRGLPMVELALKDVQYGLRTIRKNPGFAAIAAFSLALGIGANTAIFTLIEGVMLRSLPVRAPRELVSVGDPARSGGLSNGGPRLDLFSYPLYLRMRDQNHVFSGLSASGRVGRLDVGVGGGLPEEVTGRLVSGNFFDVLGVQPALGRTFTDEEDRVAGAHPVIVIGYDYWQRRFGGDPLILGRELRLNGYPFTIVGVGPRGFTGDVVGVSAAIWIPLSMQAQVNPGDGRLTQRGSKWLLLMGRLKPGVSLAQARAQIAALAIQQCIDLFGGSLSEDQLREIRNTRVLVQEGGRGFSGLRKRVERPLLTLMFVVGLVLLIACANVANLLLARAASRQKEISVRLALGASRLRIARQLLTESLLLAGMGGCAGLFLAWAASGVLLRLASADGQPIPLDINPNGVMLAFTAGVSLLTAILFGLAPALRCTRIDIAPALKESARSVTGSGGWQLNKLLVAAQVALSLMLIAGAGLFIRTLLNLQTLDVGYSRENLVLLNVDPAASGYSHAGQAALARRLIDRFASVPGVKGVTVSENGLFNGTDSNATGLQIEGFTSTRQEDLNTSADEVGPHYFQTLGVPLLAGREFDERDRIGSPRVTVINDAMAKFYFGNGNPIGMHIIDGTERYTIVGVVKDMKEGNLKGKTERRCYSPYFQDAEGIDQFNFEIATQGDGARMVAAIRREVQAFDPNLKVLTLEPVRVLMDQSVADQRLIAQLSGFFGALALVLAAMGIYGVMAYRIARRANEIGLRMALGSDRSGVVRMVLSEALVLVAAGTGAGLIATVASGRWIAATLVGIGATDPPTLASSTLLLWIVGVGAACVPAMRAARIDPAVTLRRE